MPSPKAPSSTSSGRRQHSREPPRPAIQYIRGTRGALVDAIDGPNTIGPPNADTPVVLLTATGNFTRKHLGRFKKTVHGCYIHEVINEQTGEVLDNGISQKPFDLTSIGPMTSV